MMAGNGTETCSTDWNLITKIELRTTNWVLFLVVGFHNGMYKAKFFSNWSVFFQHNYIFIRTNFSKLTYTHADVTKLSRSQLHSGIVNTQRNVNLSEKVNVACLSSDRMYPFQFQFSECNFWRKGVSVNRYS